MEKTAIIKKGKASRVVFFYPGEEGTFIMNADVTLYQNGIVHIAHTHEELTTFISNVEIVWRDIVTKKSFKALKKDNIHYLKSSAEEGSNVTPLPLKPKRPEA